MNQTLRQQSFNNKVPIINIHWTFFFLYKSNNEKENLNVDLYSIINATLRE